MSVIVEFTIATEAFELGRALRGAGAGSVELERVVPTDATVVPFFWVRGGDHDALEATVAASDSVDDLTVMDRIGDSVLYRITWTESGADMLDGIVATRGAILDASGDDTWTFQLRFPDHDRLAAFSAYCDDSGLDIHVERVYPVTPEAVDDDGFDLTAEQHEALELALDAGYFATPRETSMSALAAELGISQQAFSDRLRRGTEKVLRSALRG